MVRDEVTKAQILSLACLLDDDYSQPGVYMYRDRVKSGLQKLQAM